MNRNRREFVAGLVDGSGAVIAVPDTKELAEPAQPPVTEFPPASEDYVEKMEEFGGLLEILVKMAEMIDTRRVALLEMTE